MSLPLTEPEQSLLSWVGFQIFSEIRYFILLQVCVDVKSLFSITYRVFDPLEQAKYTLINHIIYLKKEIKER